MARLIDVDELLKQYQEICNAITCDECPFNHRWRNRGCDLEKLLSKAPTVDPVKHGHWIYDPKDAIQLMFTLPICSECGSESADGGNYCSSTNERGSLYHPFHP